MMTAAVRSLLAALAACVASAAHAEIGALVLQWQRCAPAYCETGWYASPAVADVDRDGIVEVFGGGYRLLAARGDTGALLWTYPPSGSAVAPGRMWPDPAVADVDGDGDREIVVVQHEKVSVLDATGALLPGWPRSPYGAAETRTLAVADLDRDGASEILVARASGGNDETWTVLQPNGTTRPGWPRLAAPDPGYAWGAYNRNLAVGDLDGDGTNEIVVVGSFYDCRVGGYPQLFQVPTVFEVDRTRWASGAWDWTQLPVPDAFAAPLAIDYQVIESAQANPVLADLDGDGTKEISYSSYDGRVHAFWLDRTEHGNWPFDVNLGESELRFASEPVVADLDGDGDAEVVFTTWTEKGSNAGGDLLIVDALGNELQRVPLPRSASSWDGALAAPTVANLDADPLLEVVVNTAHTGLVAYEIPGSTAIAAPRWPTGRGNVARTAPEVAETAGCTIAFACLSALSRRRRREPECATLRR